MWIPECPGWRMTWLEQWLEKILVDMELKSVIWWSVKCTFLQLLNRMSKIANRPPANKLHPSMFFSNFGFPRGGQEEVRACYTPKINIEPENDASVQMLFLFLSGWKLSGSKMLFFGGGQLLMFPKVVVCRRRAIFPALETSSKSRAKQKLQEEGTCQRRPNLAMLRNTQRFFCI